MKMKKLITFLSTMALTGAVAFAGDFRQFMVITNNITAVTNAFSGSVDARIESIAVVGGTTTSQVLTVSLVTGQYTNTIPILTQTLGASTTSTASNTVTICVAPNDNLVCSMTTTSAAPVYIYFSFANGRNVPVSNGMFN